MSNKMLELVTFRDRGSVVVEHRTIYGTTRTTVGAVREFSNESDAKRLKEAAESIRKHWSFDEQQQHTHSWHDREDFIEKVLPGLLGAYQGRT